MTKHILIIIRLITRFPVEKLEYALTLYIQLAEKQLGEHSEPASLNLETAAAMEAHYDEAELCTIKEAMRELCASRWKIDDMRRTGELQTIERNSRSKRLIRSEVELAKKWSHDKGKR